MKKQRTIKLTDIVDKSNINYCPVYLHFLEPFEITGVISNDINEVYDNKFFNCSSFYKPLSLIL